MNIHEEAMDEDPPRQMAQRVIPAQAVLHGDAPPFATVPQEIPYEDAFAFLKALQTANQEIVDSFDICPAHEHDIDAKDALFSFITLFGQNILQLMAIVDASKLKCPHCFHSHSGIMVKQVGFSGFVLCTSFST